MGFWDFINGRALSDLQADITYLRHIHAPDTTARLTRMEALMADNSALLNQVADGLTSLGQPIADLIAENTSLAAENASLKGEDAAESAAADRVKAAYDEIAGRLTSDPGAPDVPPVPDPEQTPAPEPQPEPAPEPSPAPSPEPGDGGDGDTPVA